MKPLRKAARLSFRDALCFLPGKRYKKKFRRIAGCESWIFTTE